MKKVFYTEFAYILGILILALGTAFMARANFGMASIVAPAFLFHLKISETFSFFSFGMAEYTLQAFLIIVLALIQRRFKKSYLFSFVTAVIYGFSLDAMTLLVNRISGDSMGLRIVMFTFGTLCCCVAVACFFKTYISPEVYELFVKEMAEKFQIPIGRSKTIYDCTSCIISVILSFAFFGFGQFVGVNIGTVICALFNGWMIGKISIFMDNHFEYKDGLALRKYFE